MEGSWASESRSQSLRTKRFKVWVGIGIWGLKLRLGPRRFRASRRLEVGAECKRGEQEEGNSQENIIRSRVQLYTSGEQEEGNGRENIIRSRVQLYTSTYAARELQDWLHCATLRHDRWGRCVACQIHTSIHMLTHMIYLLGTAKAVTQRQIKMVRL